jgi:hypothetical protein
MTSRLRPAPTEHSSSRAYMVARYVQRSVGAIAQLTERALQRSYRANAEPAEAE